MIAIPEASYSGCSKRSSFSPTQPGRPLHPPALSLPRQPLRPGTRLIPCKAAASEEARRYIPHFVWAVRPCNGSWRTEKPHQYFRPPRGSLRYVEPLSDARTTLADFFSILLERPIRRRRKSLQFRREPREATQPPPQPHVHDDQTLQRSQPGGPRPR
jgi:hypothetical protein